MMLDEPDGAIYEVELSQIDFNALWRDLSAAPVYLPLALGNGSQFEVLLVAHGVPEGCEIFDGRGKQSAARFPSTGRTVLWVALQHQGAYPFGLLDRNPLPHAGYVQEKFGLLPGDAPQLAYLIGGVRAAAQGKRVEDLLGLARWVLEGAGWAASDKGRLPEPVARVIAEGVDR